MQNQFYTVVNCMDGRVQLPVIRYLRKKFDVEYVDSITEAGPNRILAEGADPRTVEAILARVQISVERHRSAGIAIAGHADCAGNPAPEATQIRHIRAAVEFMQGHYPRLPVTGLWVDENWQVHETD